LVQGWPCMEDAWKYPIWTVPSNAHVQDVQLCTVMPSLNNQHHILTFPSLIASSSYTSTIYLWISAGQTFLTLKIVSLTALHMLVGHWIFVFVFNNYSNWREKKLTPYYIILEFLTYRIGLSFAGMHASPAELVCRMGCYFLDASCIIFISAACPTFYVLVPCLL
jgi:hypothetical protein